MCGRRGGAAVVEEHTNEKSKGGKASGSILASLRLTRKSDFYSEFLSTLFPKTQH